MDRTSAWLRRQLTADANLTHLNLRSRSLRSIDAFLPLLSRFLHLEHLDLSSNFLTHLPHDLSCLTQLRTLDLRNNSFRLPTSRPRMRTTLRTHPFCGLVSLPSLETVYLSEPLVGVSAGKLVREGCRVVVETDVEVDTLPVGHLSGAGAGSREGRKDRRVKGSGSGSQGQSPGRVSIASTSFSEPMVVVGLVGDGRHRGGIVEPETLLSSSQSLQGQASEGGVRLLASTHFPKRSRRIGQETEKDEEGERESDEDDDVSASVSGFVDTEALSSSVSSGGAGAAAVEESREQLETLRDLFGKITESIVDVSPSVPTFDALLSKRHPRTREDVLVHLLTEIRHFFHSEPRLRPVMDDVKTTFTQICLSLRQRLEMYGCSLRQAESDKESLIRNGQARVEELVSELSRLESQIAQEEYRREICRVQSFRKMFVQASVTPRFILMRNLAAVKKVRAREKRRLESQREKQRQRDRKRLGARDRAKRRKGRGGGRRTRTQHRVRIKPLSLNKITEIVEEIYDLKVKHDQTCRGKRNPRKTIKEFYYEYLSQKFGLRSVVLEWNRAILEAIKRYAPVENDVRVFRRIFENAIDEEFRLVQAQLKHTVFELLRADLRNKLPMKRQAELNLMQNRKMKGDLYEMEWASIVEYMYHATDARKVVRRVKHAIRNMSDEIEVSEYKIRYSQFVQVLLNFQLVGHENFLRDFCALFRRVDKDKDGVLNEFEFAELVHSLHPFVSDEPVENWEAARALDLKAGTMTKKIDPFQLGKITFSECVSFFSSADGDKMLVRMMSKKQRDILAAEEEEGEEEGDLLTGNEEEGEFSGDEEEEEESEEDSRKG